MSKLIPIACASYLLASAGAAVAVDRSTAAVDQPITAERSRYVVVDAPNADVADLGLPPSTIYLNRHGAALAPGFVDDSRTNTSVLARFPASIPPFTGGDAAWTQVVSCMQSMFSRYNITVTDVDPGSATHIEAIVGGSPFALGLPASYGGVAPMMCGVIDTNGIVFVFPDALPQWTPQLLCEVAAQEVAHAFTLDHEVLCSDPMSYCPSGTPKTFQDVEAPCGEFATRQCMCGSASQNSHQALLGFLGGSDGTPPTTPPSPIYPPPPNYGTSPGCNQGQNGATGCNAVGGSGGALALVLAVGFIAARPRRRGQGPPDAM